MSFATAVASVLLIERGYVNDPADHGGETNFGITVAVARAYGYMGAMKDLPIELAKEIYKKNYWDILLLDGIATLYSPLADEMFDSAVNCGPTTSCKWLQNALSALTNPPLPADGAMGVHTLAALAALRPSDFPVVVKLMNVQQGAHYLSLTESDASQKRFIRGWLTRVA